MGVYRRVFLLSHLKYIERLFLRLLHVNLSSSVFSRFCDVLIHSVKLLIVVESHLHHLYVLLNLVLEISKASLQMREVTKNLN